MEIRNYLVVFLAAGFFATGFFATAGFAAAGFFAGAAFAATGFLVAAGFAVVFVAVAGFTPAALAAFASPDLRRAAVFFLIRPFLTALSISLCAFDNVSAAGVATKAFVAVLMSFLIPTLRALRLIVCFIRLMADLIIGIVFLYLISYRYNQSEIIEENGGIVKCCGYIGHFVDD